MKFINYTKAELRECGREFVTALNDADREGKPAHGETEAWTEFVLDWFSDTKKDGLLVDARPPRLSAKARRDTAGEFLVDLSHSTYPLYSQDRYSSEAYWEKALKQECRVRLALECEWGKEKNARATRVEVFKDAIKIAAMNADVKVMVFGPRTHAHGLRLMEDLKNLRMRSGDTAPWLLVAFPWKEKAGAWSKVIP
jgi:hypothetical protein